MSRLNCVNDVFRNAIKKRSSNKQADAGTSNAAYVSVKDCLPGPLQQSGFNSIVLSFI